MGATLPPTKKQRSQHRISRLHQGKASIVTTNGSVRRDGGSKQLRQRTPSHRRAKGHRRGPAAGGSPQFSDLGGGGPALLSPSSSSNAVDAPISAVTRKQRQYLAASEARARVYPGVVGVKRLPDPSRTPALARSPLARLQVHKRRRRQRRQRLQPPAATAGPVVEQARSAVGHALVQQQLLDQQLKQRQRRRAVRVTQLVDSSGALVCESATGGAAAASPGNRHGAAAGPAPAGVTAEAVEATLRRWEEAATQTVLQQQEREERRQQQQRGGSSSSSGGGGMSTAGGGSSAPSSSRQSQRHRQQQPQARRRHGGGGSSSNGGSSVNGGGNGAMLRMEAVSVFDADTATAMFPPSPTSIAAAADSSTAAAAAAAAAGGDSGGDSGAPDAVEASDGSGAARDASAGPSPDPSLAARRRGRRSRTGDSGSSSRPQSVAQSIRSVGNASLQSGTVSLRSTGASSTHTTHTVTLPLRNGGGGGSSSSGGGVMTVPSHPSVTSKRLHPHSHNTRTAPPLSAQSAAAAAAATAAAAASASAARPDVHLGRAAATGVTVADVTAPPPLRSLLPPDSRATHQVGPRFGLHNWQLPATAATPSPVVTAAVEAAAAAVLQQRHALAARNAGGRPPWQGGSDIPQVYDGQGRACECERHSHRHTHSHSHSHSMGGGGNYSDNSVDWPTSEAQSLLHPRPQQQQHHHPGATTGTATGSGNGSTSPHQQPQQPQQQPQQQQPQTQPQPFAGSPYAHASPLPTRKAMRELAQQRQRQQRQQQRRRDAAASASASSLLTDNVSHLLSREMTQRLQRQLGDSAAAARYRMAEGQGAGAASAAAAGSPGTEAGAGGGSPTAGEGSGGGRGGGGDIASAVSFWQDEVASLIARPLSASSFCQRSVQSVCPGAAPAFDPTLNRTMRYVSPWPHLAPPRFPALGVQRLQTAAQPATQNAQGEGRGGAAAAAAQLVPPAGAVLHPAAMKELLAPPSAANTPPHTATATAAAAITGPGARGDGDGVGSVGAGSSGRSTARLRQQQQQQTLRDDSALILRDRIASDGRFRYSSEAQDAATLIQRRFRYTRRFREPAATQIQRMARGWLARRLFRAMRALLFAAATRINSGARVWLCRRRVQAMRVARYHRCAATIQAMFRRRQAGLLVTALRLSRLHVAATRVQALFRGRQARRRCAHLRRLHRAATVIQCAARCWLARRRAGARLHQRRKGAARQLQRLYRGHVGRRRALHERRQQSALVVQRLYRGHMGRRAAVQARHDAVARLAKYRHGVAQIQRIAAEKALAELTEFLNTAAGKRQLKQEAASLKAHRKRRRTALGDRLTARQRKREAVREAFELFDVDCSGSIDRDELLPLTQQLCLPLTESEVDAAMMLIDADGSGAIEFHEFFEWYMAELGGQFSLVQDESVSRARRRTTQLRLIGKRNMNSLTGSTARGEAKRALMARAKEEARHRARRLFSEKHRWKFTCAHCYEVFPLKFGLQQHTAAGCPWLQQQQRWAERDFHK